MAPRTTFIYLFTKTKFTYEYLKQVFVKLQIKI